MPLSEHKHMQAVTRWLAWRERGRKKERKSGRMKWVKCVIHFLTHMNSLCILLFEREGERGEYSEDNDFVDILQRKRVCLITREGGKRVKRVTG